ncbi:MAG: acetate--CoA ligase alpha subunit [Desulfurispora sp.]|uniref:acetate--CoA ligase alpha subunit n=1 Tax=Desulfurispora sp. TaxID=3014275 RepID=UPI0040490193
MADLSSFFSPRSVAVIGASRTPGKIGYAIVDNIIKSGYSGTIVPVNPREQEILGHKCYSRITEAPGPIDMAVISVPAAKAVGAVEDCARAGVKNLVIITAGFKEVGKEGLALEKQIVALCQENNITMLGPNCVGMMDTHTPINASFAVNFPRRGDIAFISQSGAMLVAILDWSRHTGLGFSKVISLGNKASLTESHFIDAVAADPNTRVVLCYIEDVANGKHFLEVARRASRQKPVIILKSGTSQAGAQAASSHTGALAGSDLAYNTAFKQTGIIRASTMAELFDLAIAFSNQPVPRGKRVVVVTNAGGPGIVTTDRIENQGLKMARFEKETIDYLRQNLPAESNIYNPVDVLGDATVERYQIALQKTLADPQVDSAVVLVCPTAVTDAASIAQVVIDEHRKVPEKPVFAAYMGGESLAAGARRLSEAGIPCYTFPETAIDAIRGMSYYREILQQPASAGDIRPDNLDPETVRRIFQQVRRDNRLVLLGSEAVQVMEAYGIPCAPTALATSPDQAVELAQAMGYPLVMKIASPKILHKTDVGGVKIGIADAAGVKNAFAEIMENVTRLLPNTEIYGIEIQKMMPRGTEIIIGMIKDVQFGPLIACGLGGIYVNLLKDVSFRLADGLTRTEIEKMLSETKAYTLLRGYRGEQPADINTIVDMIARTACLVGDFTEISELDINPVFAYPTGARALDVKITIA